MAKIGPDPQYEQLRIHYRGNEPLTRTVTASLTRNSYLPPPLPPKLFAPTRSHDSVHLQTSTRHVHCQPVICTECKHYPHPLSVLPGRHRCVYINVLVSVKQNTFYSNRRTRRHVKTVIRSRAQYVYVTETIP